MLIALDYETNGLEYYAPDFKVESAAFTWKEGDKYKSLFVEGQEEVEIKVRSIIEKGHDILVYNYQFEYGVTKYVYGIELPVFADVQRLVQYWGPQGGMDKISFGLAASVERILGITDYKSKYHKWIKENLNIPKNQKPGRYINQLPKELLEEYNKLDTEFTFRLFDFLTERFQKESYDWSMDHALYVDMVKLFANAKARGIKVDLPSLQKYTEQVGSEIADIDSSFNKQHQEAIDQMLLARFITKRNSYKSEKHKEAYTWEKFKASPLGKLNWASSTQLAELIVTTKQKEVMAWSHYNDDGSPKAGAKPSFSTKVLSKWGEDTQLLVKRGKRKKVREFCNSLVAKAETSFDGRWHQDLKAVGTITGRFAGGGKLNIQGVPRRDKGFMGALLADERKIFVGVDYLAGEPTVTTQYTKDKHYSLINSGKPFEPYWNAQGFLVIDDIYIATMSMQATLKERLIEYWNKKYSGKTFAEQWLEDKEVIKEDLKKWRQIAKALCLGLGYGMMPKKLRFTMQSSGLVCTLDEAQETYANYWKFFSGISHFTRAIQNKAKKDGKLINEFGFRSSPQPRKAYNWMIQSTINPLICLFTLDALSLAPWAEYIVLIHDEVIFQIPEEKIEEFKSICKTAEGRLNSMLNWSVKVRTGYAVGKSLYEAK